MSKRAFFGFNESGAKSLHTCNQIEKKLPRDFSFFFLANDILIFGRANQTEISNLMNILEKKFHKAGLALSVNKSKLFITKNASRQLRQLVARTLGFQLTSDLGKDLGLPLLHTRSSVSSFSYLVDNLTNKLAAWKSSHLPMVGRVVLAKSTLSALPTYSLQAGPLPSNLCSTLDKITRNFI